MVALVPTQVPHLRNGSGSGAPHFMESVDGTFQAGWISRLSDNGLTAFVYDRTKDPLDSASYTTQDLSAIPAVVAALGLLDPGNGVYGLAVEDDHFALAAGLDDQGRLWLAGNGHADPQHVIFSDAAAGVPNLASWNTLTWASMPWAAFGANAHTYNRFSRFNGQLVWIFDQQGQVTSSQGRDVRGYYLPVGRTKAQIQAGGTSGWRPIVDTATGTGTWTGASPSHRGDLLTTTNAANSPQGPTGDPTDPGPANRAYIDSVVVENRPTGDRLHITFNWRTADTAATSSQQVGYAYTDSIGLNTMNAWRNVDGVAIPAPLQWGDRALFSIPGQPARTLGGINLAIKADGRPVLCMQNGVSGVGRDANYGDWIRAERIADSWVLTNLGLGGGSSQGHPSPPQIAAVDPARRNYTITSFTSTVGIRSLGGNIGGPSGSIPNGESPVGKLWGVGGPILSSGTVTYGTTTAGYAEQFHGQLDPVAYQRTGRLDLLIPDGDRPRIYSLFNSRQIAAS